MKSVVAQNNTKVRSKKRQENIRKVLIYSIGGIIGFLYLVPFLWMVLGSLKFDKDILSIPLIIFPDEWDWQSYRKAFNFQGFNFQRYTFNTAFVTIFATLMNVCTSTAAGYGFAKYNFKGNNILFIIVLATIMIPFQAIIVPLFMLVKDLGMINTFSGLIIPLGMSAFGVFMMRQFFYSVPNDYIESARIDGANEFMIFMRVSVPMAMNSILALTIFHAQMVWNVLIWPLIVISKPSMRTLPQAIALFSSSYMNPYPQQLAICVVACLPILILYLFLSKYFVHGVHMGGLKA